MDTSSWAVDSGLIGYMLGITRKTDEYIYHMYHQYEICIYIRLYNIYVRIYLHLYIFRIQAYIVSLCFTLLCFTDIMSFCKLKVCGNPVLSKSICAIFPTVFAPFVFLNLPY